MVSSMSELSREVIRAGKGTVLMRQGELGNCAYFVVQGRLIVEREEGEQRIFIAEIGSRDLVGELAILDDAPRSATVTVIEDALLIVLNKHRIRSIIRRSPNIAELILKLLSAKLRNTHQRFLKNVDLSNPEVWIKICNLLELAGQSSEDPTSCYQAFTGSLMRVLDFSRDHHPEIILRLEKAQMLTYQQSEITSVNEGYLEAFLYYCREEFSNEDFDEPSAISEYYAVQWLVQHLQPNDPRSQVVALQKEDVVNALANSELWQHLHPIYQQQRANLVLDSMLASELISPDPDYYDQVIMDMNMLREYPMPQGEIQTYSTIKQILTAKR